MSFAMNPEGLTPQAAQPSRNEVLAKKIGLSALAIASALTLTAVLVSGSASSITSNSGSGISSLDQSGGGDSSGGDSLYTPDTSSNWAPAGFTIWSADSNIAWKWNKSATCTGEYTCWKADFISETGCSYFYAALNILDANDSVINYTNASLPSLLPMQTATLQFNDIEGTGSTGQMSVINCG